MAYHSLIAVLVTFAITVDVPSTQEALESFRVCIVDQGLSPDLIVHHSTSNTILYEELDHRWNVRPLRVHPLAYFVPRITSDVQAGVRCARANNIPIIPKSGGHSAELLSYGNKDTIVIAFQNMKNIQINATEKTAVIESGALLGEIRQKLLNEGELGLSSGSCDYVGIGGIALGGGEGRTTPIYNLTVDNILEMEMVDSNGDLHLVNENVNSDLYWALRGVGPGYIGIVTSFKFKLFNATDLRSTRFSLTYDLYNIEAVLMAFQIWLVWAENEGLLVRTAIYIKGAVGQVEVMCTLLEEISSGQSSNQELFLNKINETFPPLQGQAATLTFPSYAELANYEDDVEYKFVNTNPPIYIKKKSFFVNRTLSANELKKLVQVFHGARNLPVIVYLYAHTGPFNKIPATDMSYVHRGHLYFVTHRVNADAQVNDEMAQLALEWLNEFDTESKIMDSGSSYQNYVDLDLSDNFMERYYGVNSERLIEIKRKWDPDNYFHDKQSIPISNMASKGLITLPILFLCLCSLQAMQHSQIK